ncbi:EAL domain-containing protein [Catenovulum sp. SM1970]|nr:EAL domain-containing protein [Marinifaba aquimaris]
MKKVNTSVITTIFLTLLAVCSASLFNLDQPPIAKWMYMLFALTTGASYFLEHPPHKKFLSIISFILIFAIGHLFPLDIEDIEEIYIGIPILYLLIFPGSLWPIAVGFAILTAYMHSVGIAEMFDIVEDGLEVIVITTFACVMSFYQQQTKRQMMQFREESYTDYLTGLSNRKKFQEFLYHQVDKTKHIAKAGEGFALINIDLDGFKKINDQLGHQVGDQLLKQVGRRLESFTGKDYSAYRVGGDEFAFIIKSSKNIANKAQSLSESILKQATKPYELTDKKYKISASIGIAIYPQDAFDAESLVVRADLAMYKAKAEGKGRYSFYQQKLTEKTIRYRELEADLKLAAQRDQLSLYYQPKVDIQTGKIFSAEALLRWHHPKYGHVSPFEFIKIAEEDDTILDIGRWVAEQACKDIHHFKAISDIENIAINVSARQLADIDFVDKLKVILAKQKCPPHWIEIEQTESVLMQSTQDNIEVLKQLKEHGFSLSLDDFGTSYSSLSQLGNLPIDILKIDKRFVDHCDTNNKDHMIVRTIIQLAQNLGLRTIAEGVETQPQLEVLKSEGCASYQGYLFSKPLPTDEFEVLLKVQTD